MRPTAIVHIGTGKAGSTTIQNSLFGSKDFLQSIGILIPEYNDRHIKQKELRDIFLSKGSIDDNYRILNHFAFRIQHVKPSHFVLSSEYLYDNKDAPEGIKSILRRWSDDIKIVLYVREPVTSYISHQQQRIRAHDIISSPYRWKANYKKFIQIWRHAFGQNLSVIPFQPSEIGSNITVNLLSRFIDTTSFPIDAIADLRSNVSDSAEVTCIMQKYFRANFGNQRREFRKEADYLRKVLNSIVYTRNIGVKAQAKEYVRDILISTHRDDLNWMKENAGVSFDAVDYTFMSNAQTMADRTFEYFFDIVDVQRSKIDLLESLALHELSARTLSASTQLTALRQELKDSRNRKKR